MSLFICDVCHSIIESERIVESCPICHSKYVILSAGDDKRLIVQRFVSNPMNISRFNHYR